MPDQPDHARHVDDHDGAQRHGSSARLALDDFRRRVDVFWGHPRTAELSQALGAGTRRPRRVPPATALRSRLRETLATIERIPEQAHLRLQKGLTYRDGELVSVWGDDRPLAPDDRVLVVTTTTTVMDANSLAVETSVLVFEREA
jgi:hypothetical protein